MEYEEGFDVKSKVYHHHASFIFPKRGISRTVVRKIIALVRESEDVVGPDGKSHVLWDQIGGRSSTEHVPKDATAFYWRDGMYVTTVKLGWKDYTDERKKKVFDFIKKCQDELLEHSIDGKAAYLNYIDSTVGNWQDAYYGANYHKLREVKTRVDRHNFFRFDRSIELLQPRETKFVGNSMMPLLGITGTTRPLVPFVRDPLSISYGDITLGEHIAQEKKTSDVVDDTQRSSIALSDTQKRWDTYAMRNKGALDEVNTDSAIDVFNVDLMVRMDWMKLLGVLAEAI